jgi:hypothetical protein
LVLIASARHTRSRAFSFRGALGPRGYAAARASNTPAQEAGPRAEGLGELPGRGALRRFDDEAFGLKTAKLGFLSSAVNAQIGVMHPEERFHKLRIYMFQSRTLQVGTQ